MWSPKNVNYICRILNDEEKKFKFDLLLRSELLITDGKKYNTFEEASEALCKYMNKIYLYDKDLNIHGEKHLIINEAIFE